MAFWVSFFSLVGLGLLAMGFWGLRRSSRIGLSPGMDEKAINHRQQVMRRCAYLCIPLGLLFLVAAGMSFLPQPPPS